MPACSSCGTENLDIDVKCSSCGAPLGNTGAHRMVGNTVLGHYEIVDVIGSGGMSVVYRGRHKITEQDVALKLLPPELAAHAQVKSRFLEEARALAQLDHPNIVHLYNFGQEGGSFVLAMQFVAGQTWERMILSNGRQEWPFAVRIAIDVLRALEYAHGRGIIHRDMKPSNVLVRDSDGAATVMDFGIAKMTTSSRLTATGQTMGTVRYMSPEQVRGQEVDLRTDLYSLGATLYEAVVGDTPFDGNTHFEIMTKHLHEPPRPPSDHGIELPPDLEAAIMKSMAKKPDDRFQSARDFRKVLEQVMKDSDVGLAETQRVSRESIQPSSSPVHTPSRSLAGPTTPLQQQRPQLARAPAPTGLADRLEPEEIGRNANNKKTRTWLWLGLGGVVMAASAAVAVMMIKDGDARPGKTTHPIAIDGGAAAGQAKEYLPPDVAITTSGGDPAQALTVHLSNDWSPAEVVHVWTLLRDRYAKLAKDRGVAVTLPDPWTIVVVPARVLCDKRTYENGVVSDGCETVGNYYRPIEHTLLVADDRPHLELNLGVGLAGAVCVWDKSGKACDLVDPFEQTLRNGSKPSN